MKSELFSFAQFVCRQAVSATKQLEVELKQTARRRMKLYPVLDFAFFACGFRLLAGPRTPCVNSDIGRQWRSN